MLRVHISEGPFSTCAIENELQLPAEDVHMVVQSFLLTGLSLSSHSLRCGARGATMRSASHKTFRECKIWYKCPEDTGGL